MRRKSEKDLMKDLTPRTIVEELDKYIIGQGDAKKAVAIAIRNRWRRLQLTGEMREEVMPKNIIMIGPTGVGKTEIARRLAGLVGAPFLKVEASKYTEVGYVGRSVESMIRDLTKVAVNMVESKMAERVQTRAAAAVNERLLKLLFQNAEDRTDEVILEVDENQQVRTLDKNRIMKDIENGKYDKRVVETEVEQPAITPVGVMSNVNFDDLGIDITDMLDNIASNFPGLPGLPKRKNKKKMTVKQARQLFMREETEKLIDRESIINNALEVVQNLGIIFIDELDKVCGKSSVTGPDISGEGVQRDLLPIVEGTTVNTRFGMVRTDHILFIAAGAFYGSKPSDLIPEMQGRFPIRVELNSLTEEDFVQILKTPKNSLTKQYVALLNAERVKVKFTEASIKEIARVAAEVNARDQNIGARRLHTIIEKVFEDISFEAPEKKGQTVTITPGLVHKKLKDIVKDANLTKYIL